MKQQVFYIHGGMTFRTHEDYLDYLKTRSIRLEKKIRWSDDFLEQALGNDVQLIKPAMPSKYNAKYEEWKIHFERFFEYLHDDIIFIGNSLGAIFLAKYFSENKFAKKIKAVFLVGAPYDDTLSGEDLAGGFDLPPDLHLLEEQAGSLHLLFSKDDEVIPLAHADKYKENVTNAHIHLVDNANGHFQLQEFPFIVELLEQYL